MAQSFKDSGSAYPFVVFATADLPESARTVLRTAGITVREIAYLEPEKDNNVELDPNDHRFADTWTKLRCFELLEYEVSSSSLAPRLSACLLRKRPRRSDER